MGKEKKEIICPECKGEIYNTATSKHSICPHCGANLNKKEKANEGRKQ